MDERENKQLGDLIFAIASGNSEAVREIYERVGKVMTAVASVYLTDRADVEETVSDALCMIVRKANRFRENKNAYAWINTIVKNLARDKLRTLQSRREVPLEACSASTETDEEAVFVREMLSRLGEREREAVIYRYWYGMSLSEIAEATGKAKSSVKYLIDRALEKLRENFTEN